MKSLDKLKFILQSSSLIYRLYVVHYENLNFLCATATLILIKRQIERKVIEKQ